MVTAPVEKSESLTSMWHKAMYHLVTRGQMQKSRVGDTLELLSYKAILTDPEQNFVLSKARKADPAYGAAEFIWYMTGTKDTTMLQHYAPSYKKFTDDGVNAHGAYGPRIKENIPLIVELLRKYPDTRQAVLAFWTLDDIRYAHIVNDMPCTVCLQFILRNNKLNCFAYMRSNDVWLGMPYDVFCFTMVQRLIADQLGVPMGWYVHDVGSLHLYDKNKGNVVIDWLKPQEKYHRWDLHQPLNIEAAIELEQLSRAGNQMPSGQKSPMMDLANICIKKNLYKMDHDSVGWSDGVVIRSEIMNKAWELKYGRQATAE